MSKRETETLRNQLAEAKGHGDALLSQNESLSKQNGTLNHKLELVKLGENFVDCWSLFLLE